MSDNIKTSTIDSLTGELNEFLETTDDDTQTNTTENMVSSWDTSLVTSVDDAKTNASENLTSGCVESLASQVTLECKWSLDEEQAKNAVERSTAGKIFHAIVNFTDKFMDTWNNIVPRF